MGNTTLAVTAPHATPYDADYPTRSTENYSHALHDILQDMEDATGEWYLSDGVTSSAELNLFMERVHDNIETVFNYAEGAIDTYRATGTATLTAPAWDDLLLPYYRFYPEVHMLGLNNYNECMKMMYFIYYMWKTEEDPLLLKEKLQELLIAWPLLDTTIELSSELGQQFKVYPSWKNADLDL